MQLANKSPSVSRDEAPIDFRRSLPPHLPQIDVHLATVLDELSARNDLGSMMRQSSVQGGDEDRAAAAELLRPRFGQRPDASRIIITNGTQNAVLILLRTLAGAKGLLLAEKLSYGALGALVRMADVQVQGLEIDADGIIPDAFAAACSSSRPAALYCNPTVHNPTTSVMPETRRLALADIARRHGVPIIEDDALGLLHPDLPRPIAALAPDVTWYVMSLTKCLSQGLRLAYLLPPAEPLARKRVESIEHLSCWHGSPLSSAIITRWIANGTAAAISSGIARECTRREALAREVLAGLTVRSTPGSMHIWVELPCRLHRSDLITAAENSGVLVRPSDVFAVDAQPAPNAVRLSLSPPADLETVRRGLDIFRSLVESPRSRAVR